MYKSLLTYLPAGRQVLMTSRVGVALRLKLGFVLAMKDLFFKPQLLEAFVVRRFYFLTAIIIPVAQTCLVKSKSSLVSKYATNFIAFS